VSAKSYTLKSSSGVMVDQSMPAMAVAAMILTIR